MPVDLALFQGAVTALKSAADLAIGLSNIKTVSEVQAKAVELQQIILAAQTSALATQSEQFALLEKLRDLEKEIADVKAWEAEKNKYELKEVIPNVLVYSFKEDSGSSEPPHKLCANCYQDERKSILQQEYVKGGVALICHACSGEIMISGSRAGERSAPVKVVRRTRSRGFSTRDY